MKKLKRGLVGADKRITAAANALDIAVFPASGKSMPIFRVKL